MTHLRIRLLGQLSLEQNGNPVTELSAKALEMFCYLLLYRDRPHTREALAAALWSDTSAERAQKYLRQTLWQLQTVLERHAHPEGQAGSDIVGDTTSSKNGDTGSDSAAFVGGAQFLLAPGWIRVNPHAAWWLDIEGLEQAYRLCRELPGDTLTAEQAGLLEAAVALYRGDLLETWHQDWCIYERERLQLTYLALLDKLVAYCTAQRLYARGIDYAQRILRCDIARESTYQELMRLHYLSGDRTTALREYARCVQALKREFDLPPMQATVALYEQIRAERLVEWQTEKQPEKQPEKRSTPLAAQPADQAARADDGSVRASWPPAGPFTGSPGDLNQQVAQLQGNLAGFQAQMQQELKTILYLLNLQIETSQQIWRETY